jgi:hypothetical protein
MNLPEANPGRRGGKAATNRLSHGTVVMRSNKLRLPIRLANTEHRAYEHFNQQSLTNLTIYLMKK